MQRCLILESVESSQAQNPPSIPQNPAPITTLCKIIQDSKEAVERLGYLRHPSRSFSQRIQVHNTSTTPSRRTVVPVSSLALASNQTQGSMLALSRKQRFGIAASISWAVLLLSDTEWLSERLDADEIQLMLDIHKPRPQSDIVQNTCVSHCFGSPTANPALSPSPSVAVQFLNSHIRNKTLFALGILLIEMCLDRPFVDLRIEAENRHQALRGIRNQNVARPATMLEDFDIADKLTDKVYREAGSQYGYAVQRCLRCEFPGINDEKKFQFPQFRTDFYRGVVAPIQATYILISESPVKI